MNVMMLREATKRWAGDVRVLAFNPGFIPSSGLFREPRKDNWFAATAFTFVATYIARFAVPIDVGGARLAALAASSKNDFGAGEYLSAEVGSSAYTKAEGFDKAAVSAEAQDDAKCAKLWELSAQAVGCVSR